MSFEKEKEFEDAVVAMLQRHGWGEVINNPTEDDLIRNWADILFQNNRDWKKLNNYPLTEGEGWRQDCHSAYREGK